ncbi:7464_t:CDS:2 [Gigaspora margarita]|uniref:7464_t:CDS:1 n=1 Tax=Gigaspora margarita TaxID=4874 RepID=A0ABN7UCK7_GIGMA|nr:7464_t:CDS:2 [Gigaspora margarita]
MSYLDEPIENNWLGDCIFYDNGDFISIKNLSKESWKINNSIFIEPTNFVWNNLCNKENFILLDTYGTLTQWNLNTLSFEKQYHLGLNRILTHFNVENALSIFNKESTLLAVFLEDTSKTYNIIISVYLTENSLLLSQCKYRKESKLLYWEFISFDEGERLILFFENGKLEIQDPYDLKNNKQDKINEKIYIVPDRQILVQEISKQQWIKYLREKLGDHNKIRALPRKSQVKDFLQTIIQDYDKYESILYNNIENQTYESKNLLVKWIVTQDKDKNLTIVQAMKAKKYEPAEEDWKSVDKWKINSEYLSDQNRKFVYKCKLLDNRDLIMITSIGLLILTIQSIEQKDKIRFRYYRGSGFPFNQKYIDDKKEKKRRNRLDNKSYKNKYKVFIADREPIQKLLNDIKDHPSLSPDFQSITNYRENRDLSIFF